MVHDTLNDGVLEVGEYRTKLNAARKAIGKEFVSILPLHYKQLSMRESDYARFNTNGSSIDMKVKTLSPPNFISKDDYTVKINNRFFTVTHVDTDRYYLYFYLHLIEVKEEGEEENESINKS